MKKLSALKIYKILLDIVWYGTILGLVFLFIQNLFSLLAHGELSDLALMEFPVEVNSPQFDLAKLNNTYTFINEAPATVMLELSNIKLSRLTDPFILLSLFSTLIGFGFVFYQLSLLRALLSDVIEKRIFIAENVKRLRLIGIVELMYIPVGACLYLLFNYLFANQSILDQSLTYAPDYWDLFSSLPHALEYLIFAGIFSFGLQLKQEQDLTI